MDPILTMEDAALRGPGHLDPALRQAAAARGDVPAELTAWVDLVANHAYRATDADVAALMKAGRSEDEVFELTVATAVGAGMRRFRAGMAALAQAEATP